jgi:aspartate racemase
MKTIGLIGGMSWESSLEYYRIINERVKEKLGGLHSAECLMWSFDFAEIEELQMAGEVQAAVKIPVLHIADTTAEMICADGLHTIGLLGTRFTMEQDFYKGRLTDQFGLKVLVPDEAGREIVHRAIYDELCLGMVRDDSRAAYLQIMDDLVAQGAQAIILGCTEITLLIKPEHTPIRLYDTTRIHAESAVDWALKEVVNS